MLVVKLPLHQRALEVLRVGAVAVANLGQQVGQALEQEARRRVVLQMRGKRRISQLIRKAPPQTLRRSRIIAQP